MADDDSMENVIEAEDEIEEILENVAITSAVSILGLLILFATLRKVPRTKGKDLRYHAAYIVFAIAVIFCLPEYAEDVVFSPGGVLVVGTLIPVYESIRAVCSIGEADDKEWLQYWLASGTFTYATEWMDIVAEHYPIVSDYWYQFELITLLWMLLPFTDGSALLNSKITVPYIVPLAESLKSKLEGQIAMLLLVINAGYLTMIWFVFLTLDEEAKRFIVVAAGTVYPLVASIVSMSKNANAYGITFWLTYWSCFSILFISMDYIENFLGTIPGFYSLCLCATVYLFLPMFNGAEVVFRKILVPLSGQQEQMYLRDVDIMRLEMQKAIPAKMHDAVFTKAAGVFLQKKNKDN